VHAPNEDKSDDTKDSFYEKLEHVFNQFPTLPHVAHIWEIKNVYKILAGELEGKRSSKPRNRREDNI